MPDPAAAPVLSRALPPQILSSSSSWGHVPKPPSSSAGRSGSSLRAAALASDPGGTAAWLCCTGWIPASPIPRAKLWCGAECQLLKYVFAA